MSATMTLADDGAERGRRLRRIRTMATAMTWGLTALMVLLSLFALLIVLVLIAPETFEVGTDVVLEFGAQTRPIIELGLHQRLGLAATATLTFAIILCGSFRMRQMFSCFARLDFFSQRTLSHLFATGWWLIAFGAVDIITGPVGSVLLSLDRPQGERTLAFTLESGQLFLLVFGPVALLFGWVLREAAAIEEENRQFV